jgi:hypothetical protein
METMRRVPLAIGRLAESLCLAGIFEGDVHVTILGDQLVDAALGFRDDGGVHRGAFEIDGRTLRT